MPHHDDSTTLQPVTIDRSHSGTLVRDASKSTEGWEKRGDKWFKTDYFKLQPENKPPPPVVHIPPRETVIVEEVVQPSPRTIIVQEQVVQPEPVVYIQEQVVQPQPQVVYVQEQVVQPQPQVLYVQQPQPITTILQQPTTIYQQPAYFSQPVTTFPTSSYYTSGFSEYTTAAPATSLYYGGSGLVSPRYGPSFGYNAAPLTTGVTSFATGPSYLAQSIPTTKYGGFRTSAPIVRTGRAYSAW